MKSYFVLKKLPATAKKNCFSQSQRKRWIRRLRTMEESMMSVASSNIPIPRAQKNFLETLRSVTANHSPVKTVWSGVYDQLRIDWLQRLQRISLDSKRKSCLQFKLKPQRNREKGSNALRNFIISCMNSLQPFESFLIKLDLVSLELDGISKCLHISLSILTLKNESLFSNAISQRL